MREIKFRAWDSLNKTFFVPIYEAYLGRLHDISISMSGQVIERTIRECADIRNSYRFILMQYTGLKDKNGKEIYEGDIIINKNASPPEDGGFIVKFVGFEWLAYNINFQNEPYYSIGFSSIISERFEVIGNIYENPELLK